MAFRMRGYVPQRHKWPFIAERICDFGGLGRFRKKFGAFDDHAVETVPALYGLFVDHGLLHRMERGRVATAFSARRTRQAGLRAW